MKLTEATGKELKESTQLEANRHANMPGHHQDDPYYEHNQEVLDHIKKTNPALYKKMLAWG